MNIDKRIVAQAFSKAALTYNQSAQLQQQVGQHLLSLAPPRCYQTALDLGCGTGYFARPLLSKAQSLLAIDLSHAMASQAKSEHASITALVSDAEQLALANNSVDLVFSSLALQWCNSLSGALSEIKRVLKPGGVALFSTLLDGSLYELQQAWQAVDQRPHVNRFLTQAQVADAISNAGFNPQGLSAETVIMAYQHPLALLKDLKGIGANYVVGAKRRASTPAQLNKMIEIYQQDFSLASQPESVSATYQLGYGVLIND
ncbi:malonyl-ACP O-methyltransferase BioC [Agarivorans sp.]|uniref:malonyl-ACP O-methyltransferase BioC n=1 Tax=Agarivorans sp. TaxID=1872412 RepID=UPI003D03695D